MISRAHPHYWEQFNALPEDVQRIAKEKYRLWERDCFHPSLHFKPLRDDVWSKCEESARIIRALGRRNGNVIVWFWIEHSHAEYDKLV